MERNSCKLMIKQFEKGRKVLPEFQNEEEEKLFLQLQKYNLIHLTPQGVLVITRKGREALKTDVEKYLYLERYEQRLIKDSMRTSLASKWLFFAVIPIIVLVAMYLVFLLI